MADVTDSVSPSLMHSDPSEPATLPLRLATGMGYIPQRDRSVSPGGKGWNRHTACPSGHPTKWAPSKSDIVFRALR